MADFSARLKHLRDVHHLSQEELASKIGSTRQAVSQYERSVRKPSYEDLTIMADIFNVTIDYLLGRENVSVRLISEDKIDAVNALDENPPICTLIEHISSFTESELSKLYDFADFLIYKRGKHGHS